MPGLVEGSVSRPEEGDGSTSLRVTSRKEDMLPPAITWGVKSRGKLLVGTDGISFTMP